MGFQLPVPVQIHFEATNAEDSPAFLSAFAENAAVTDDGKEYRGLTAIKAWSDRIYFGDHLRLTVLNAVQNGTELVVTAKSEGDYDKTGLPDPLFLDFHFIVEGDKVTRLRTALSANSKAIPLPRLIAAYYHACAVYDETQLAGCFAQDAVLRDEGENYRGPATISAHILEANRNAKVMTDITACGAKGNETVVTATLAGAFEGSPIPLDFHFSLEDEKIKALNITLEGK
jgi:hypothetical protein